MHSVLRRFSDCSGGHCTMKKIYNRLQISISYAQEHRLLLYFFQTDHGCKQNGTTDLPGPLHGHTQSSCS